MQALPLQRHPQAIQLSLSGQLTWYVAGALIAFLLPFLFSSVLDLDSDLYYSVYFTGAVAFLALYAITTRLDLVGLFTRNWRWSLALGLLVAAILVAGVTQREDSTPHPDGLYFAFTILWRGLLYGVVDALILTAFPVLWPSCSPWASLRLITWDMSSSVMMELQALRRATPSFRYRRSSRQTRLVR